MFDSLQGRGHFLPFDPWALSKQRGPDPDLHFISKPNDRILRVHPRPPTSFAPAMKKSYKTQYYSISRECP